MTVISEFLLLLQGPVLVPTMLWTIAPLVAVTLAMTLYFGKYPNEKLGWNTVLGNSIVLVFVALDLLRTIHSYSSSFGAFLLHPGKILLILLLVCESFVFSYAAFKHKLPKIMFFFASAPSINSQAYILTTIVYLRTRPSLDTILAAVLFFVVLLAFLRLVQEIQHFSLGKHAK